MPVNSMCSEACPCSVVNMSRRFLKQPFITIPSARALPSTVVLSFLASYPVFSQLSCFWRTLRNVRILTPLCLEEQLRHVRDQYAPCKSYILAWMNLYAQGMWPLLLFFVPFALIFEEKPEQLGASSWEFYTLQAAFPETRGIPVFRCVFFVGFFNE